MAKEKTKSFKEFDEFEINEIIGLRDEAIAGYIKHKTDFIKLEEGYVNVISDRQRISLTQRRKSALTPNLIKPKVDKIVRDIMKAFFGQDELAMIQPEDKDVEDDAIVSEAISKELKEYGRDRNLYTKCKPIARDLLVYGTAVAKVYFNTKENDTKIEQVKLSDVYLDPYAPSGLDIRFLVHKITSMTIADLEAQYKTMDVDWEAYANSSLLGDGMLTQDNQINKYQRVEFHEVYRKKNDKWYVTTILNDDVVLRLDKVLKDSIPFIIATLDPQLIMINEPITPVRAYGSAFIASLLAIQTENTIKRNQQLDAIDMQLNQRFITTKTSGLREDDLSSNRKKIVVDSITNIRELPIPRLNDSIFGTDKLEMEAQEISGISKFAQGINDKQNLNQTATGMNILTQEASNVSDDINRAFNENFFRPLVQRIVKLTYQYKESKRFIGIDRTKPLRQKVIINVGIGSTNKIVALQNIDNAIMGVQQSIPLMMQVQDMILIQKYIKILDSLTMEKLKLLGQDSIVEEVEEEERKMLEQKQQMMMQPQGEMYV